MLFATAEPSFPFAFDGGSQRGQYELVRHLTSQGIEVLCLSCPPRGDTTMALANARQLGARVQVVEPNGDGASAGPGAARPLPYLLYEEKGFTTMAFSWRGFTQQCARLANQRRPDLIVTWLAGSDFVLKLANDLKIRSVLRFFDPVYAQGHPPPAVCERSVLVANAPVTARAMSERYGRLVPYLLEPIDHDQYRVQRRQPKCVTFVNPSRPKGLILFREIASRLPDIPFLVVRGWSWGNWSTEDVIERETVAALRNVTVVGPLPDMREAYQQTKVLLAPSRWLEAWGRVAAEAQVNGIPVLASNRGSLPQNIGAGGCVLDYGDPDLWAQTIRRLYEDQPFYDQLGRQAVENLQRFPFTKLMDRYTAFLQAAAAGRQPSGATENSPIPVHRVRRDAQGNVQIVDEIVRMNDPVDMADPAHP